MKYEDLLYSKIALVNGIDNIPTPNQKLNIEKFAKDVLAPIYKKFGEFKIVNGYLKIPVAKKMGKKSWSYHTQGQEIDIYFSNVDHLDVLKFLYNSINFTFVKLENNIMHICACPEKNGKEIFINGGRKSYNELFPKVEIKKEEIVNESKPESEDREETE